MAGFVRIHTDITPKWLLVSIFSILYCIMHVVKRTGSRRGGGGAGRSEMAGNLGPGGVGGSLPVSPYFSFNLKFKCLYTFGYILDLSAEISFFAMVHSTL